MVVHHTLKLYVTAFWRYRSTGFVVNSFDLMSFQNYRCIKSHETIFIYGSFNGCNKNGTTVKSIRVSWLSLDKSSILSLLFIEFFMVLLLFFRLIRKPFGPINVWTHPKLDPPKTGPINVSCISWCQFHLSLFQQTFIPILFWYT